MFYLQTLPGLELARRAARLRHALERVAWPFLDLAARSWLAKSFLSSALVKLADWPTALLLSSHEYPVAWLNPVTAAYLGESIELVGSIALLSGFMTRYAACAMLALTCVIQVNYRALDAHLFWAMLFGWYAVHGAGPISLDQLLRRGIGESALPWAGPMVRASAWVRSTMTSYYLAVLRLWLGASLLQIGRPGSGLWLPLSTADHYPAWLAVLGGYLLMSGVAVRAMSITLLLLTAMIAMMDVPRPGDTGLLFLLAILGTQGAGWASIDAAAGALVRRLRKPADGHQPDRPRVVIVGAGFAGLSCARALRDAPVSVTLIDRTNYHLFQPMLYQVATAALPANDIAIPIRSQFRESASTRVRYGVVTGVDPSNRQVQLGDDRIAYDYLVLATGATHSYFGKEAWSRFAPGLKRIEDATLIRRRLLSVFERAENTDDPAERQALLTFLIVGGGPTGVELAGAIAELARFGMEKDFRRFDPAKASVILVQSAERILPTFPPQLSARAERALTRLGVTVLTKSRVQDIDQHGAVIDGRHIAAGMVLWAAGVVASPAARWLGVDPDRAGRIKVGSDLGVEGMPGIYAIGDTALSNGWHGGSVPGLAAAAKQQGAYAARAILNRLRGQPAPSPFAYRHLGSLATIGRQAAVADFGWVRLWGAPAWWLWGLVHLGVLMGTRNRLSTAVNWIWSYFTLGGAARLITGSETDQTPT